MKLTELESSLIARNIQFQKIHMLPTSRYTANTDKIINVPVPEDSALNTINSLPRTPNEPGLIGVEVKRKLGFKNTHHKAQMINVDKIYKATDHLKKAGKRLSKISVTFKTHNGDSCECFKKLISNKIIVPCDVYRSNLS